MTPRHRHWTHRNANSHPHFQPHQRQPAKGWLGTGWTGSSGAHWSWKATSPLFWMEDKRKHTADSCVWASWRRGPMVHTQDSPKLAFGPRLALAPKHSGANKCLVRKTRGCFVVHQIPPCVLGNEWVGRGHSVPRLGKRKMGAQIGRSQATCAPASLKGFKWCP